MSTKYGFLFLLFFALHILFVSATQAQESAPDLIFPLDCEIGKTCMVTHYVDVNPAKGEYADFACRLNSFDNNSGTKIALPSVAVMKDGINVRAALDGTVLRLRDGLPDSYKTPEQIKAIRAANKDCGNGILLQHENGMQSFYCHLRAGTIRVRKGDALKAGDKIAQAGRSGAAAFPQLHFALIKDGKYIDPFTSLGADEGCGKIGRNMWQAGLAYEPMSLFAAGFDDAMPDFEALKKGEAMRTSLPADARALIYWAGYHNARKGDEVTLVISGPEGWIFAEQTIMVKSNRPKEPSFVYAGRHIEEGEILQKGVYKGTVSLKRSGARSVSFSHEIEVK